MRKRWNTLISLLLTLTLAISMTLPVLADKETPGVEYGDFPPVRELTERLPAKSFADTKSGDWYYENMDTLVRAGGINGFEDGTFRPNGSLKLCEFLKLLTAILFPDYLSLYADCTVEGETVWYAPYTALAEYMGLMRGVDGSKASLEARVSRYDMAKIALNTARLLGQAPQDQVGLQHVIGDYAAIPEEYREAVRTTYNEGILMGKDEAGNFRGNESLTRAEACTVVVRLFRENARSATRTEVLDMGDSSMLAVTMPRSWREQVVFTTQTEEDGSLAAVCRVRACMDGAGEGILFFVTAPFQPTQYPSSYQELGTAGTGENARYLYLLFPGDVQYDPTDEVSAAAYAQLWQTAQSGAVTAELLFPMERSEPVDSWRYDSKTAQSVMAGYQTADIPDGERVSLLTLQMEAYADLSPYGVQGLSPTVYADYHRLRDNSYHGTLVTNVFAGGTTQTEWSVLTGRNDHTHITDNLLTDGLPWYFRDQGYTVNGSHPGHAWFSDRDIVNEAMGFQSYLFMENYFAAISDDANVAYDDVFFPDLEKRLKSYFTYNSAPLYSFNVTYQGHGPYKDNLTYWGDQYCTGSYSVASRNILNNYFAIIQESMGYVNHLVNWLSTLDKPVVLVLYGDHKPWLGYNNSVYKELGINIDTATTEGFYNYYATEYLFWANDAAKRVLGQSFTGTGPTLSPCYLMDELFTLCGWDGPAYLQAQRETRNLLPILHTGGWYLENGNLTRTLTPAGEAALERFRNLAQWDLENGRQ